MSTLKELAVNHFLDLTPEGRENELKKIKKDARGDLLLVMAGKLDSVENDIRFHPYLRTANRRLKATKRRLKKLQNKDALPAMKMAVKNAEQRMDNALQYLEVQSMRSKEMEAELNALQADHEALRQSSYGQEGMIQELRDEIDTLARGYNVQKNLRTIALAETAQLVELARLGFPEVEDTDEE
jgi:predicted  nucleic acid-binding Zn-ribbon protein